MSHGNKVRRHYIEYHNTLQQSEGMLNHGDNLIEDISNSIDEFRCHGLSSVVGLRSELIKPYVTHVEIQGTVRSTINPHLRLTEHTLHSESKKRTTFSTVHLCSDGKVPEQK